ncbi:hypothetical protein [Thiopseudomonas alkaliphila]|uniref:hypothetical protein n=1 Tax=Thiopseudomonas alkaliphila TaxID=1697053 RepID=UPI00257501A6|nr:hypothetical protein [Thiopseudomonas alkaliphila]
MFKPSEYRQWSAPGVVGTHTKEQALAQLLQGLPVSYQWEAGQRLRVSAKPIPTVTLSSELVLADAYNPLETREIRQTAADLTR